MNKNETELITDKNLSELVRKANTGDKQSLAVLRHELTTENAQALVDMVGNLASNLEEATIENHARRSTARSEAGCFGEAQPNAGRIRLGYEVRPQKKPVQR